MPIWDYGGTDATDDACLIYDSLHNYGYCHQGCGYGRGLPHGITDWDHIETTEYIRKLLKKGKRKE
jgi:hypothetical protein